MYLAAYALGIGATGLTFFDDAVTEFFSPHAQEKSVHVPDRAGQASAAPVTDLFGTEFGPL
jgi:hypothetical protein